MNELLPFEIIHYNQRKRMEYTKFHTPTLQKNPGISHRSNPIVLRYQFSGLINAESRSDIHKEKIK